MMVEISLARSADAWEQLFVRSVASELSAVAVEGEESAVRFGPTGTAPVVPGDPVWVRGDVDWQGPWDFAPSLLRTAPRRGGWIVLIAAEDLDERLEALMVESRHAAALRGRTLRLVAIGSLARSSRVVDHLVETPGSEELLRLGAAMSAVLSVESSRRELARLAARAGRDCIGVGPGSHGARGVRSWSSAELVDMLENPSRTEPLTEPFAPSLMSSIRARALS